MAAAKILGYGMPEFLGYPDRGLSFDENLVNHIYQIIQSFNPEVVYAPSQNEIHPDHRVLCPAVTEAIRRYDADIDITYYEIGQPLVPNVLLDISDISSQENRAMDCFESQLKVQDYKNHINALNTYRTYTLGKNVNAAEGFLKVSRRDIKEGYFKLNLDSLCTITI